MVSFHYEQERIDETCALLKNEAVLGDCNELFNTHSWYQKCRHDMCSGAPTVTKYEPMCVIASDLDRKCVNEYGKHIDWDNELLKERCGT